MSITEKFWDASFADLKRGFTEEEDRYVCLLCGEALEKGIIYPEDGLLYEAGRYMQRHIEKAHQSVFDHLIQLDKKWTGLSDHQSNLLELFYLGKSDQEVQQELGIGSTSTIRNHRFALKEKERQAKVFLVLMELLKAPKAARVLDETEKTLTKYFQDGRLTTFTMRESQKQIVLQEIANHFEPGRIYEEKEVNNILDAIYSDYVLIRRNLIEYGFMDRQADGSQYWLKQHPQAEKTQAGVYQIKNTFNQKVLIASTRNLKTINGKRFTLNQGSHLNKSLQQDWNEHGEDAFVFEVLETLEDGVEDAKSALAKLEEKWLAKLQPYEEHGYHSLPKRKAKNKE